MTRSKPDDNQGELARYDAMCRAIAECHRVDEVKDLRDKARALEVYAKQARNTEAERRASEIRLRAERRTGELLKELKRAQGTRNDVATLSNDGTKLSPYTEALDRAGIPRQTAARYQSLAAIPGDVFEHALRDPRPTTNGMLARAEAHKAIREAEDKVVPRMPADSLWFWGRLCDFERDGYFDKDIGALLEPMTPSMRADVDRIAPHLADFINALTEHVE